MTRCKPLSVPGEPVACALRVEVDDRLREAIASATDRCTVSSWMRGVIREALGCPVLPLLEGVHGDPKMLREAHVYVSKHERERVQKAARRMHVPMARWIADAARERLGIAGNERPQATAEGYVDAASEVL